MANEMQKGGKASGILSRIALWAYNRFRKSSKGLEHDTINPLWNIDERHVQMVYDVARTGNLTQLQYLYNEIEQNDPTILVCANRRAAALSELDWSVVQVDRRRSRNVDKALVAEQISCLEESMAMVANLPEAVEHLALAPFRGFAACSPVWDLSGSRISRFESIDTWNMSYNRHLDAWMWNPDAVPYSAVESTSGNFGTLQVIPKDELLLVAKKRAIDWPALKIYLRVALGERDWGRFLETYGLPPVILTMPEFTSDDEVDKYMKSAEAVFEGRNGVVPFGTEVNYASESRGTNPFTEFIEHQQKLIVLMATGGTLTSLAESGSGTLAGGAQMDVWQQIVRSDAKVIGNAINKQVCEKIISRQKDFKGKPVVAEFRFETEPPSPARDVLELAGMASSAGFEMDAEELSQKTGYKIAKKAESTGFNSSAARTPSTVAHIPSTDDGDPVAVNAAGEAENPPSAASVQSPAPTHAETVEAPVTPPERRRNAAEDLVESLQRDFKPVADRLQAILALPDAERPDAARKLLDEIDALVPDDPAMAEVIADQMEDAFARQISTEPKGDAPAANRTVPNSKR